MSDRDGMVSGVAAGVPYVALPPAGPPDRGEPTPLIAAWHLNDPPRSAAAMASALPLAGVAAWSDASRAVAARFDFVSRAGEIAARDPQPAILLVTGAHDDPAFPLQAQRLHAELRQRYRDTDRVGLTTIPGMGHAFAAEPGIEPAPPTAEAKSVDAAVTGWFSRYLGPGPDQVLQRIAAARPDLTDPG